MKEIEKCISALTHNKNQFDEESYNNIKQILLAVLQSSEFKYNKIELYNTTFYYDPNRDVITPEIFEELLRIDKHSKETSMVICTEGDNYYIY